MIDAARGRVAVVGGGWAGCAAAVTLAEAGIPVTLIEQARTLGGRARRVVVDGIELDNGQHVLLGALPADPRAPGHGAWPREGRPIVPSTAADAAFLRCASPRCDSSSRHGDAPGAASHRGRSSFGARSVVVRAHRTRRRIPQPRPQRAFAALRPRSVSRVLRRDTSARLCGDLGAAVSRGPEHAARRASAQVFAHVLALGAGRHVARQRPAGPCRRSVGVLSGRRGPVRRGAWRQRAERHHRARDRRVERRRHA